MMNYSRQQFVILRMLMGLFMAYVFWQNLEYSQLLFGSKSVFGETNRLWLPSIFSFLKDDGQVKIVLGLFGTFGLLFAGGVVPRISAVVLWYGFASIVNYNPYLTFPSEGNIGWLLLAFALFPQNNLFDKPFAKKDETLSVYSALIMGAGLILALSYSLSGVDKFLTSTSWQNGMGVTNALTQFFVRDNWVTAGFLLLPLVFQKGVSYLVLAMEAFSLPMWIISEKTKFLNWTILLIMHILIFWTNNLWIITGPMVIHHFLVFNPQWLKIFYKKS